MMEGLKRYRHRVRGTTYHVVGLGRFNSSAHPTLDGKECVIYRSEATDSVEVRLAAEFHDGRFEELI